MSSAADPEIDVAAMAPDELESFTRELNGERCRQEAVMAMHLYRVSLAGAYRVDGHRTPKSWGRATHNWSSGEAGRLVKLGAMLARFQSAARLAVEGRMGVAQMLEILSAFAKSEWFADWDTGRAQWGDDVSGVDGTHRHTMPLRCPVRDLRESLRDGR